MSFSHLTDSTQTFITASLKAEKITDKGRIIAAVLGALLLFQTYFIGPITWVIKEIPA